jgi:hypothetical protein
MHRSLKIQTFQLTSKVPTSIIENDISLELGLYYSNHYRYTVSAAVTPGVLHVCRWRTTEMHFPFWFAPSKLVAFSLFSGPHVRPFFSPPMSPRCHRSPPLSAMSVAQLRASKCHINAFTPPFKPPLNPAPPSMVLTPLTAAGYRPLSPPRRSPGPYKRRAPPPEHPTPFPLTLELSLAFLHSHAEVEPPSLFAVIAPPCVLQ